MLLRQIFHGELPQLVMFDLDGTLVDSVPDIAVAVDEMLTGLNKPLAGVEKTSYWIGNGVPVLVQRALRDASYEEHDIDFDSEFYRDQLEVFSKAYDASCGKYCELYDGVVDCLEGLKALNVPLAIITNKSERFTHDLLQSLNLEHYFGMVICGDTLKDDLGHVIRKPDPAALLHVVDHYQAQPAQVLMVGDSRHDIHAAKAVGILSLAVPYGYNHGEPIEQFDPDYLVPSLAELVQ
ncbi:phosphoglycolate phosphatase [Parendozoicomonas haliclonae]|uniref:Phosphoglycolate phosphatase n=1 Tax=Parendozoicomonas haliclonae TaxID=1960125 RepID=A0A1X7AET1_9GAMM|nr:phosphoglycolate phosphatase [Parendozoicomonas haliclonae]SMA35576.1 Phosphoglycolate phosphatase [Parendozoicomonas haliclonae]